MRVGAGAEVFEQPAGVLVGAFEISGFGAMGHDIAGGEISSGSSSSALRCAASDFCRAGSAPVNQVP